MILDYVFALNNQSKQRHVASILHYPIKTPPRAFYCALPNETQPRFSIVHFAAQEKKKLRSNVFYNSSPYGARVNSEFNRLVLKHGMMECQNGGTPEYLNTEQL